ncbi:hypothetical protein PoB_002198800 [Plakobranchus ocellatus]|uniref:Uncharacterized protein n=1 Tax=Plakobranchus ocellatus TaxID=259542 RepID=A0AAV3ZLZ4_9GAST|nr:hypothetical protein PoB_002198800 [Plakobranchus ocellatus]
MPSPVQDDSDGLEHEPKIFCRSQCKFTSHWPLTSTSRSPTHQLTSSPSKKMETVEYEMSVMRRVIIRLVTHPVGLRYHIDTKITSQAFDDDDDDDDDDGGGGGGSVSGGGDGDDYDDDDDDDDISRDWFSSYFDHRIELFDKMISISSMDSAQSLRFAGILLTRVRTSRLRRSGLTEGPKA